MHVVLVDSFSSSGELLLTGSDDGHVIVLDGRASRQFASLGHTGMWCASTKPISFAVVTGWKTKAASAGQWVHPLSAVEVFQKSVNDFACSCTVYMTQVSMHGPVVFVHTAIPGEVKAIGTYLNEASGVTKVVVTTNTTENRRLAASKLFHFDLPATVNEGTVDIIPLFYPSWSEGYRIA